MVKKLNLINCILSLKITSPCLVGATLLMVLLVGCGATESTAASPAQSIPDKSLLAGTIVAMGNSLTEGLGVDETEAYPAQLAKKLQADGYQFQVINAGVSGETSSGALARLDWVLSLEPDIVILETGGNDGLRAIDPDLTQENISQIVAQLKAQDITIILAGMEMMENLGQDYINAFETIYPTVSADNNIILIPFFLEGVVANTDLNQPDAIHPNAAGYSVIVTNIYPYVVEAIAQVQKTSLLN